ncbi:hypothetical protein MMPV_003434 [Pyropia vietnamensis]
MPSARAVHPRRVAGGGGGAPAGTGGSSGRPARQAAAEAGAQPYLAGTPPAAAAASRGSTLGKMKGGRRRRSRASAPAATAPLASNVPVAVPTAAAASASRRRKIGKAPRAAATGTGVATAAPAATAAAATTTAATAVTVPGSETAGDEALAAVLHPTTINTFYSDHWEHRPLLLRWDDLPAAADGGGGSGEDAGSGLRAGLTATAWRRRWAGLLSVEDMRRLVVEGQLRYGADLDVTRYLDGERATYNAKECEVDAEVNGAGVGGNVLGSRDGARGEDADDDSEGHSDGAEATAGSDDGAEGSASDDDGGSDSSNHSADNANGANAGDSGDSANGDATAPLPPPTFERAGAEAWARFTTAGCSLRLLRPQASSTPLWSLASRLEAHFRCAVGANAYLTPAGTQGFAPHFDDIDAFILQVAGAKRWRVYPPRSDGLDTLPRYSSVDFGESDLAGRPPIIDSVLCPGDVLYLPRGAVHQAVAVAAGEVAVATAAAAGPSLHLTLSTSQRWTWADLLKASFAEAVESAAAEEVALRRTLSRQLLSVAGVAPSSVTASATTVSRRHRAGNSDGRDASTGEARRDALRSCFGLLLQVVARHYPLDAAVDGLATRFLSERLPPCPLDVAAHAPPPPGWDAPTTGEGGGKEEAGGSAKRPRAKIKDRSRKRQRLAARAAAAAAVRAAVASGSGQSAATDSDSSGSDSDNDSDSDSGAGNHDGSKDDDDDGWADPADGPFGYVRPSSLVRLAAPGIARLTMDAPTGLPVLRHCITNPRTARVDDDDAAGSGVADGESAVLAASPPGMLRVTPEEALGVDSILAAYPAAVAVRDVALDEVGDRVQLVRALLEARLLVVVRA